MTPQERDVIAGIFDRLKQAANQPRDPEAESFIAERLREQPYAPYAMAQAVYVQEQALTNLHAQVEELQAQVQELKERPSEPAPQQSGGFLSGIFGGGAQQQAPARPGSVPSFPQRAGQAPSSTWTNQSAQPEQQPGTMGAAPQPGPWANRAAAGAGGGFMATALTTAAGVAGGMMLGNVLANAFGGGSAKAETPAQESAQARDDSANKDDGANAQPANEQQASDQDASDQASYDQANNDEPYDPDYDDGMDGGDGDWT